MIAVVHGPRGCGKSTALRTWLARRGWMPPRGFRTFFDGPDGPLSLSAWKEGAPTFAISEKPRETGDFTPSSHPGSSRAWVPAFAPALDAFLDAVFFDDSPSCSLQVQPPIPSGDISEKCGPAWRGEHSVRAGWKDGTARSESSPYHAGKQNNGCIVFENDPSLPPSPPRSPWTFDAPAFWRAALSTLGGVPVCPLVIDELGLFETLPGALDRDALRRLLAAVHAAPRAVVVVQDRALGFWLRALAGA